MISANMYQRIFQLWAGKGSGTVFAFEHGGRQYLATAKHVIAGETDLRLTYEGRAKTFAIRSVWHSPSADVAVISPERQLAPTLPVMMSRDAMWFSQDAYFLGFPLGMVWQPKGDPNRGFPMALVKRALISGEFEVSEEHQLLLLDGHANEGFSGGPVVVNAPNPQDMQVVGIVIGYRAQAVAVHDATRGVIGEVQANTGLMLAEDIAVALGGADELGDGAEVAPYLGDAHSTCWLSGIDDDRSGNIQ